MTRSDIVRLGANCHVVVIGASSGIGSAIADLLCDRGAAVTRMSRSQPSASRNSGDDASTWMACDVALPGAVQSAVQEASRLHGPIDAMFYSAGFGAFGETLAIPEHARDRSFAINFFGLDAAVRATLPSMIARRRGAITAILSIAAMRAIPHEAYYAASKAAARIYLDTIAFEAEPFGIRVSSLCPGFVDTGFAERSSWFGIPMPKFTGSGVSPRAIAAAAIEVAEGTRRARVFGWRENATALADRLAPGAYDALLRMRMRHSKG